MERICNKVLSIVMSGLIAVMAFPAAAWAQVWEGASHVALRAGALAVQDAGYDIGWYTDDPESDEFAIETPAQLRGLSQLVNGTAEDADGAISAVSFEGKTIVQEGAISLSAGAFTPIGSLEHPFAGTYDGQDRAISSLRIDAFSSYVGLFGFVSASGALRNIRLENGVLANGDAAGIVIDTDTDYVGCAGSLVGQCDGTVSGCSSGVAVAVTSNALATVEQPYVVQRVGGLVGFARGDIAGCSYVGSLNVQVYSDTVDADASSESLRVADSFGGIVGRFGDPDLHGTLADSWNEGEVVVQVHGAGAVDRFGTMTYANAFFVGGIAGYSNGSVLRCHNGAYNADTREVTGRVFTGVYASGDSGALQGNRGADQTGGIVGGLRSVSDRPDKYNDGDPDDPMLVADCYNEAQVTGLVAVGGIVGETGVYCTIARCYNGTITDLSDWKRNQEAGKVVSARWNKPMTGGIVGELRSGNVAYCANYAEVRNIQTGYYTAGIAGCIFVSDDYPNVTGEIYACFNSGGIYTVNTTEGVEFREAGICGQNEGYVHDCITMKGAVPFHGDSPIGANDWGATSNLYVKSFEELTSSQGAALLNAIAAQQNDWSSYWFINGVGYPVLNTWVPDAQRIELTADIVASVSQIEPAPWMGEGACPVPMLKVVLTDGTELVQNADFLAVAQAGAWEMSGGGAYSAGIMGLGRYKGAVVDCARYDIGACDLSLAAVQATPMKYNFGRVVFPTEVTATIGGSPISESALDFVIYNSAVSAATVAKGGVLFPVYDSAGYISYTADGSVKTPVSAIEGGLAGLNAEIRDWWLYDRNRDLISDSAGNSYYTSASGSSVGRVYGANTSCVNLKSGSPAGYVVQVMAREGASAATGSAIGYYVIEPVNLYRECAFHSATLNGQEWLWDPVKAKFYTLGGGAGDAGKRDYDVSVPFTGLSHEPSVSLSYGDFALVEGVHYRMSYGDPDPESGGVASCAGAPNRNVTTVEGAERAGFSVLPQNTNNMSNFIVAYFDITPAALEDCEVSLASDEWAYTGNAVEPPVTVTLNGVELQKDVDFTVTYADNVERGMASWKVEPLANLGGGELSEVSGTFRIVDGEDLTAAFTLDAIADQQFNWGYDVHPALTFRKNTGSGNLGAAVNLVEGVDYTVSYSTKSITKWPDGKYAQTAPCTVTVNGAGRYTGALSATFDIVPYDAAANATGQLRAYVQDVSYGMWGKAPTGTKADADGAVYPTHETATVGLEYPIMAVQARPIIDWAAYENAVATGFDPEESGCYGTALNMTTSNNNAIGGLVNRYPGRYYDADGVEVNGNGGVYTDASGAIIAYPQVAEPGTISAKVELRCGTGGVHAGAVGMLDCGTFEYGAALDLSKVTWSVMGDCVYDGTEKHPVVGTTQSGAVLVESSGAGGSDGDYAISYSQDDNAVDAGTVHYTVTAVEGEGKHFTGTFQGAFSILPASLADADDVRLVYDQEYVVEDASVGVCPKPEVFKGQALLEEGKDYTIDYTSNTTQGTGMFLVRGMGNYTGSVSGTFGIVESGTLNNVVVSGVASAPWSGLPVKCEPVLKDGDRVLVEGTDYTVAYLRDGKATEDFTSCGTITVHLVGVGGYRGTRDVDYTVVGRDFTLAKATAAGVFYTGKEQSPVVTVRYDGEVLSSDLYTVSPVAATDAGTYRISVTSAGGQYTPASITCDFVISKAVNGLAATTKDPGAVAYSTSARTVSNPVSATGAQGAVTFAKASGDPRLKVAANGAITVAAKTPAGTYELGVATRAAGDANHNAASVIRTVRIVVAKAPNTLKVAGKTVAVKAVKLKKSAQKLKVAKVRTVKENISKGKITYKKASGNKKIAVAKSGKMTLKKGLAKGAYKVKVKATSKATANYTAKTVAFTVKVRVS